MFVSENGARGWGYKSGGEEKRKALYSETKKRGKRRKRGKKKNNKTLKRKRSFQRIERKQKLKYLWRKIRF